MFQTNLDCTDKSTDDVIWKQVSSFIYRLLLSFEYAETKYTPLNTFFFYKEKLNNKLKQPGGTKHSILNVTNI